MNRTTIIATFAALFVLLAGAFAQQTKPPTSGNTPPVSSDEVIKVDIQVVNVLCTVRDGKGKFIANLDKSDFEVRENNKPREVVYFAKENTLPLTVGLLIDSSVSQGRLIPSEQDAGAAFFEKMIRPKDAAFLISFDVNVDLLQDLTGSVSFLKHALDGIRVNGGGSGQPGPFPTTQGGGTHLFDAVYLASNDILKQEVGRRAIILITDGQDNGSKVSRQEAIRAAQGADAVVYSILFVDREFYGFGGLGYVGESVLKSISEDTGGRVFRASSNKELSSAFEQISEELRNQYSIGFSPGDSARDGSYRKLDVKVRRGGVRVQARKGYYAPSGK
jgi:VWFA-related protein